MQENRIKKYDADGDKLTEEGRDREWIKQPPQETFLKKPEASKIESWSWKNSVLGRFLKWVFPRKPDAEAKIGDKEFLSHRVDVCDVEVVCDLYNSSIGKRKRTRRLETFTRGWY